MAQDLDPNTLKDAFNAHANESREFHSIIESSVCQFLTGTKSSLNPREDIFNKIKDEVKHEIAKNTYKSIIFWVQLFIGPAVVGIIIVLLRNSLQ